MSNVVIKVENLSKQYRLGDVSTGTLSHDVNRWWHQIRGKEDPYLKIGDVNDRTQKGTSEYVWSLRDINFEVKQGEVLGIIGRNGAGKSTLLKILSKVTQPTKGEVKIKGRVASLLEVGTGFHPELSGRENIFLNGAILGMTKKEIKNKFDEIIDFAGVERYIDTPVKRYSSGMYVRLAFGVAAYLEPEILIVDEVLAVGDAEFQKKCLGKMKDVSVNDGRTVLFVSHNMGAIKELCDKAILLEYGKITEQGDTHKILKDYLLKPIAIKSAVDLLNDAESRRGNGEARFVDIVINNGDLLLDPEKAINIKFKVTINKNINNICFNMMVRGTENNDPITTTGIVTLYDGELHQGSTISFNLNIPPNVFRTGLFPVYFWVGKKSEIAEDNYPFDVIDSVYYFNISSGKSKADLGYNSFKPVGYFNVQSEINDLEIK